MNIDPSARIEVDFTRKITSIAKFLKRCKPFTSGIDHAFDHVIECFNNAVADANEEAAETDMSEDLKVDMIK